MCVNGGDNTLYIHGIYTLINTDTNTVITNYYTTTRQNVTKMGLKIMVVLFQEIRFLRYPIFQEVRVFKIRYSRHQIVFWFFKNRYFQRIDVAIDPIFQENQIFQEILYFQGSVIQEIRYFNDLNY